MEELTIRNNPMIIVRRVLGVICLICAITWMISRLGSLKVFDWMYFISFMLLGGSHLTNGFGTEKSIIQAGEGYIKVKWMNKIRPVIIQDVKIEKITLTKFKVLIDRKEKKQFKINLDFLEKEQKKEVYEFLIDYTKKSNLELVRDFN